MNSSLAQVFVAGGVCHCPNCRSATFVFGVGRNHAHHYGMKKNANLTLAFDGYVNGVEGDVYCAHCAAGVSIPMPIRVSGYMNKTGRP